MAALRQLLNARGTEAKMAALGYQISAPQVPDKTDSDRSRANKTTDSTKLLHSKFNDAETPAWQHPLLRKDQAAQNMQDAYPRSNSFDDYSQRPNHLQRSVTDTNVGGSGNRDGENGFSMDVSSIYEDNESPALSPALNQHLALRPLNTQTIQQTQEEPHKTGKTRRRSRSATQDSQPGYYGTDPWENYRKEPQSAVTAHNPKRKESLGGMGSGMRSSSKPPEESSSTQLMRDRQRSPTQLGKVCCSSLPTPHHYISLTCRPFTEQVRPLLLSPKQRRRQSRPQHLLIDLLPHRLRRQQHQRTTKRRPLLFPSSPPPQ